MKHYKGFIIDLDGTMYKGDQRIATAEQFVRDLITRQLPFIFLTNNATKTPEMIAERLSSLVGQPIKKSEVYTSSLAVIDYLKVYHKEETVFVIGESAFKELIDQAGLQRVQTNQAQVVIQGLNRQTNYEELTKATQVILNGAKYLVTNEDRLIPQGDQFVPSSGAITAFIEHATNRKGIVFGKPHQPIMDGVMTQLGLEKEEVLLIGDNYETDIQAGICYGVDTLMLLTGVSTQEDITGDSPTYLLENLSQWEF